MSLLKSQDLTNIFKTESTSPLAASAVFTGEDRDCLGYGGFGFRVFADQTGTLVVEDSIDSSTWRTVQSISISASTLEARVYAPQVRYMRVKYTNGATGQAVFELTTVMIPFGG